MYELIPVAEGDEEDNEIISISGSSSTTSFDFEFVRVLVNVSVSSCHYLYNRMAIHVVFEGTQSFSSTSNSRRVISF